MRDINEPLRKAYAAALTQVTGVGVFYQYLPDNINPDSYIVYRSINNNDNSTKNTNELSTTVTVEIHTKANIGNRGLSADTIADQVLQIIYPSRQTNIALSRGQVYNTELTNDVTQDFTWKNQFGFISRILTFRHLIYVDGSAGDSNASFSLVAGAVYRLEYTGTGNEVSLTNTVLRNKNIIEVNKDGVSLSGIITSGLPVNKEVLYSSSAGTIRWVQPMETGEKLFVLYQ